MHVHTPIPWTQDNLEAQFDPSQQTLYNYYYHYLTQDASSYTYMHVTILVIETAVRVYMDFVLGMDVVWHREVLLRYASVASGHCRDRFVWFCLILLSLITQLFSAVLWSVAVTFAIVVMPLALPWPCICSWRRHSEQLLPNVVLFMWVFTACALSREASCKVSYWFAVLPSKCKPHHSSHVCSSPRLSWQDELCWE